MAIMETNEVDINTEYLTYAGINRSALILGMPMIPMVLIIIFFATAAMFAMPVLENRAWAIVLLALPCLWFLREVTAKDDQALRILGLELYWFFQQRNMKLHNNTFAIYATRYGRQHHEYIRIIAADADKAARTAELFAPCQSPRC